ncbi:MAG: hypothetical protein CTY31_12920 [Hyphomicrobium sp.]|jgi:hypothetical protein|nr:MAG: hypothetical protein CTY31_12920 [Hyphomicrobium sp.]
MTKYPLYYEEAAHILRVLTDCGIRLNPVVPPHMILLLVAEELERIVGTNPSHAAAGAYLVQGLAPALNDDGRRRKLNAIAGTLIGNFLLTCRRPAPPLKSEKLGEPGVAPRNPSASEKSKVRDWARWG